MRIASWIGGLLVVGAMVAADGQFTRRHLYDEKADAKTLIAAGLKQARAQHKRVLLDFGGDWCGDCQVLDIYFRQPENEALLAKDYVVVHVFVNESMDNHPEVAAQYGVAIGKGVPALAVLNSDGSVLYAQRSSSFSDVRHMESSSVHDFLVKWKG